MFFALALALAVVGLFCAALAVPLMADGVAVVALCLTVSAAAALVCGELFRGALAGEQARTPAARRSRLWVTFAASLCVAAVPVVGFVVTEARRQLTEGHPTHVAYLRSQIRQTRLERRQAMASLAVLRVSQADPYTRHTPWDFRAEETRLDDEIANGTRRLRTLNSELDVANRAPLRLGLHLAGAVLLALGCLAVLGVSIFRKVRPTVAVPAAVLTPCVLSLKGCRLVATARGTQAHQVQV
jgi:hypothetical protein